VADVQKVAALFMQAWTAENPQACIQRGDVAVQSDLTMGHGQLPVQMS
jgi:hypothetical protein